MWLEQLKKMKEKSGLTTREIAEASRIPEPTLEKIFSGATKDPKLTTMQQLVHFLGYTVDDLVEKSSQDEEALPIMKGLSDAEMKMIVGMRKLKPADKDRLLWVIECCCIQCAPAAPSFDSDETIYAALETVNQGRTGLHSGSVDTGR